MIKSRNADSSLVQRLFGLCFYLCLGATVLSFNEFDVKGLRSSPKCLHKLFLLVMFLFCVLY